jgi:C4-dicarboxylate-specific signal transduction histidine kinase
LFGQTKRDKQPIDINQVIVGVLGTLNENLAIQKVSSRVELEATLPSIAGHRGQLQEVFINLVQNAIDAMGPVGNSPRVVTIRTMLGHQDKITVEVEDTGAGIDPEQMGSIFGAFVTTKQYGTGLGLTVCRMIIESHGGSISASSDRKTGAMFRIVLPTSVIGQASS